MHIPLGRHRPRHRAPRKSGNVIEIDRHRMSGLWAAGALLSAIAGLMTYLLVGDEGGHSPPTVALDRDDALTRPSAVEPFRPAAQDIALAPPPSRPTAPPISPDVVALFEHESKLSRRITPTVEPPPPPGDPSSDPAAAGDSVQPEPDVSDTRAATPPPPTSSGSIRRTSRATRTVTEPRVTGSAPSRAPRPSPPRDVAARTAPSTSWELPRVLRPQD